MLTTKKNEQIMIYENIQVDCTKNENTCSLLTKKINAVT